MDEFRGSRHAVANKLLKQVFGVVKNETLFDRNYYKKIA
jgi:hypothetical protein